MKIIFFDAGPVISLVMSRLVWILPELKKKYGGKFYITPAVRLELVERPLNVHRFQFEALQVMKLINDGVLEVYEKVPKEKALELKEMANSSFSIEGRNMDILQSGEVESVAAAWESGAEAVVMDERTLRLFIENSAEMEKLLERRFRKNVVSDGRMMRNFSERLKGITIIRSVELVSVAYKLGLLDGYVPRQKGGRELLVESILWAEKYNGCAVTEQEIEEMKKELLGKK